MVTVLGSIEMHIFMDQRKKQNRYYVWYTLNNCHLQGKFIIFI